jgi:hypothetical protein
MFKETERRSKTKKAASSLCEANIPVLFIDWIKDEKSILLAYKKLYFWYFI